MEADNKNIGPSTDDSSRGRKQVVTGVVVSDKMQKTRVIEIKGSKQHGLYHKKIVRKRRLFVHDENNTSKVGDTIIAQSIRPLSKNKSFTLVKVVER